MVSLEKHWDYLIFQCLIEIARVAFVGDPVLDMAGPFADRKTVRTVKGLSPPSVENAKVQPPIEDDFLSACPGGLQGASWIVEPHIDPLDQMPAYVDVVILDEYNLAGKP